MKKRRKLNEYATAGHARSYLARADQIPHRAEGEAVLLELLPRRLERILDLGTGDGRLLAMLRVDRPDAEGMALDFSPTMLDAARERFFGDEKVQVVEHNLDDALPEIGRFDAIVSSFAIHHCADSRKRSLYAEIHSRLTPGGVFFNLEHVASPTPRLHRRFLNAMGIAEADEDPSNQLLDVETQLGWLREIGFEDVDCFWKWLELALLGGVKRC